MTDDESFIGKFTPDESRREFMKKGVAATAATGLAASGIGTAAAQADDADDIQNDQTMGGAMFNIGYRPGAAFIITSPVVEWTPDVDQNIAGPFRQYNTRIIQYTGTNEQVQFFMSEDASVPQYNPDLGYVPDSEGGTLPGTNATMPQVYRLSFTHEVFGGGNRSGLIAVQFHPVEQNAQEQILTAEGVEGFQGTVGDEPTTIGEAEEGELEDDNEGFIF